MIEIARLLIRLDEVEPPVSRRIEVPLAMTLDELHRVVQASMGWENYHLYEFSIGRRRDQAYGVPDPDGDFRDYDPLPASETSLAELLAGIPARAKRFAYVYDFGDNWRHTIKLEAIGAAAPDTPYPRLLAAEGACPPEDAGGPDGYARYLEAIADPGHERHAEMIAWRGAGFDPADAGAAAIRARLAGLTTPLA